MKHSVSLTTFTIVLVTIGALVLIAAGTLVPYRANKIAEEYAKETQLLAVEEARKTIRAEWFETQQVAKQYASWEEVPQQLFNPRFYDYWRTIRSAQLPGGRGNVSGIELYRPDGTALSNELQKIPTDGFPPRIAELQNIQTPITWVAQVGTAIISYAVHPVVYVNGTHPEGYVVVKSNLSERLRTAPFRYVDEHGVTINGLKPGQYYLPKQVENRVVVQARASEAIGWLSNLNEKTVLQYSAIITVYLALMAIIGIKFITRPLRRLARALKKGGYKEDNGFDLKELRIPGFIDELVDVVSAIAAYRTRLTVLNERLSLQNSKLLDMAYHDQLTGVPNRRALEKFMNEQLLNPAATQLSMAFMLIDCDNFKSINDRFGHATGDGVLCGITTATLEVLRPEDSLYRLGGDEFAVILIGLKEPEALHIAQRVWKHIQQKSFSAIGVQEPVVVSIGVAITSLINGTDFEKLKAAADTAMYRAKANNCTKVIAYSPDLSFTHPDTPSALVNCS